MGVGKYTPNDAINGDMGWKPPYVKQWTNVCRHWERCTKMDTSRINFKVFKWSLNKANSRIKNWNLRVMEMFRLYNFNEYCNTDTHILNRNIILQLEQVIFDKYKADWSTRVSSYAQGNKLRTYKLFKNIYGTELYLQNNTPLKHRSSYAKFRCGVAPLRVETGRYERKPINERTCFVCTHYNNIPVEDEFHVILNFPLYADLRQALFNEIVVLYEGFNVLNDNEKFIFLFSNEQIYSLVAKTCYNILTRRNSFFILLKVLVKRLIIF